MSDTENSRTSAPTRRPWQFQPGVCPNPGGKPKVPAEVVALAREYTTRAIHRLGGRSSKARTSAPRQQPPLRCLIEPGVRRRYRSLMRMSSPLSLLHLIAAKSIAAQLQSELDAGRMPKPPDERNVPLIDFNDPAALARLPPALE